MSTALLFGLRTLALLVIVAPGASADAQNARAVPGGRGPAVPTCVNDPAAKATLYGHVPLSPGPSGLPSTVQIFQETPAVDAYVEMATNSLAGRSTTPSPSDLADADGISKRMATLGQIPNVLASAKVTSVRSDGYFVCRGFRAERYIALVDVRGVGPSSTPGGGKIKISIETYYRGSADVGDIRRPAAVGFAMQSIGRTPP